MNKIKNSIFREELPGEKKSIVNLLMTGHIVTISCLSYMAFFLFIQLGQVTRIVDTIDPNHMTAEQVNLLKERVSRSVGQWQNEMIGLAIIGSIVYYWWYLHNQHGYSSTKQTCQFCNQGRTNRTSARI